MKHFYKTKKYFTNVTSPAFQNFNRMNVLERSQTLVVHYRSRTFAIVRNRSRSFQIDYFYLEIFLIKNYNILKYFRFSFSLVSMTSDHLPCGIHWLYLETKQTVWNDIILAPSNLFGSIQSRLLFSVYFSLDHFLLLALRPSEWMHILQKISPYCEIETWL
jgi:hypothetical protein